jgi:hypothetical protein
MVLQFSQHILRLNFNLRETIMTYEFPSFTGTTCNMMPVIQGDPDSLPDRFAQYGDFIESFTLEPGEIGLFTVQESFVDACKSQRGYGNSARTLHTEGTLVQGEISWGPSPCWGGRAEVQLARDTRVLICNSISDTCMTWDAEAELTPDGDLGHVAHLYPRSAGNMMAAGELREIGILTPHECIPQKTSGQRFFARLVGVGVTGREEYFTVNEKLN